MPERVVDRRTVLRGAGIAAIVAIAGCTSDDAARTDNGDTEEEGPIRVGPGGETEFNPDDLEVSQGTTLTFIWESSGHNIEPTSQPEDGNWEGVSETQDEGYEHSHTFDTTGMFEYVCSPHEDDEMAGTIEVLANGDDITGDDGTTDSDDTEDEESENGGDETEDGESGNDDSDDGGIYRLETSGRSS